MQRRYALQCLQSCAVFSRADYKPGLGRSKRPRGRSFEIDDDSLLQSQAADFRFRPLKFGFGRRKMKRLSEHGVRHFHTLMAEAYSGRAARGN